MKLRHLLSASLLCGFGMAGARDVHGVKGYYNWTPLQMQASSVVQLGPEGYKWESWSPDFLFEDDYLNWRLGVNNTTRRDSSGFEFRSRLDFREAVKGTGFVTMTPDYPIYVFKVSLPMQTGTKKEVAIPCGASFSGIILIRACRTKICVATVQEAYSVYQWR